MKWKFLLLLFCFSSLSENTEEIEVRGFQKRVISEMDAKIVWNQTLPLIKDEVSDIKYKTFIQPIVPVFANDDMILLTVPDEFSKEQVTPIIPLIKNSSSRIRLQHWNWYISSLPIPYRSARRHLLPN